MKLFLFKKSDTPPEYVARMKDGETWIECGNGYKKMSAKGTAYLEIDFSTVDEMNAITEHKRQEHLEVVGLPPSTT